MASSFQKQRVLIPYSRAEYFPNLKTQPQTSATILKTREILFPYLINL